MKKEVDALRLIDHISAEKDMQPIQELLSPEARKKFNQFMAKFLAKRGATK